MESYLARRTAQTEAALAPPVNTRCAPLWHYHSVFGLGPQRGRGDSPGRGAPLSLPCVCVSPAFIYVKRGAFYRCR